MRLLSSFVLGYHGCGSSAHRRLRDGEPFIPSNNDYDWLGPGVYFWEANPRRALEWAQQRCKKPRVIGAVIDFGNCLDLFSSSGIAAVRDAYRSYESYSKRAAAQMPSNETGADRLFRRLDCAVIRHLHWLRQLEGQQEFDTVRGIFREGKPIYPKSGFYEKTHIQICVCNRDCIKAVFQVPQDQLASA